MYQDKTFSIVSHTTIEISDNPIIEDIDVSGKSEAEIEIIKQQLLDAHK